MLEELEGLRHAATGDHDRFNSLPRQQTGGDRGAEPGGANHPYRLGPVEVGHVIDQVGHVAVDRSGEVLCIPLRGIAHVDHLSAGREGFRQAVDRGGLVRFQGEPGGLPTVDPPQQTGDRVADPGEVAGGGNQILTLIEHQDQWGAEGNDPTHPGAEPGQVLGRDPLAPPEERLGRRRVLGGDRTEGRGVADTVPPLDRPGGTEALGPCIRDAPELVDASLVEPLHLAVERVDDHTGGA